jgi:hypothetical protein
MKSTEEILEELYEKAYLWEDGNTIDLEVNNKEKSFAREIIDFKCVKCGNNIINDNEHLLQSFTETVKGTKIQCKEKECEQMWFIHKPVSLL